MADMERQKGAELKSEANSKKPDWKLLVIRLIAGGYLIYLAVNLLKETGDGEGPAYLAGPVVFFAAGILIGGWAVVKLLKREYER